jgi:hypothetical protein
MLENTVKRVPNRTALAVKRNDEWVKWTYTEYQVMFLQCRVVIRIRTRIGSGFRDFVDPDPY